MLARKKVNPLARFATHAEPVGDCLIWRGGLTNGGYGRFKLGGKTVLAHRFAYEAVRGPIPAGLQLDHLCHNRACVCIDHLEATTARVNVLRGDTITAANAAKLDCKRGHPLSGPNVFVRRDGRRRCRTCERATQQRIRATAAYRVIHAAQERARRARQRTSVEN